MDPMAVADSATQANMMAVVKRQRLQDFFFHKVTMGFSLLVLCALMGIIVSLFINALPTFTKFGARFLWYVEWDIINEEFGAAISIVGTVFSAGIALLLAGAAGGFTFGRSGSAPTDKAAIETVVHNYILEHPEVLPEAMENLRRKETGQQLAGVGDKLKVAFPGAVMGNPNGKVVLVEFTDFACTFCRQSVPDVEALIAANPDLKIVIRELPIIAPTSPDAARWGLAAADQGKYPEFHKTMFAAGRTDALSIEAAARAAGLDLDRARKFIQDPRVKTELANNLDFARQLAEGDDRPGEGDLAHAPIREPGADQCIRTGPRAAESAAWSACRRRRRACCTCQGAQCLRRNAQWFCRLAQCPTHEHRGPFARRRGLGFA